MAWSGSGTEVDPYLITTIDELIETTGSSVHYYYKLMNDLDLSSYSPWITLTNNAGAAWIGSLDGNNKKISNLTLNPTSIVGTGPFVFYDYVGLFGDLNLELTESAYIKNLYIDSVNISFISHSTNGLTFIGTLAARNTARLASNIHITNLTCSIGVQDADSTSYNIGGLFADSNDSKIYSCSISASKFDLIGNTDFYDALSISLLSVIDGNATYSQCYIKDCTATSDIRYTNTTPYDEVYIAPFYLIYGNLENSYVYNCLITSSNYVVGFSANLSGYNTHNNYTSINPGNTPSSRIYPFIYSDLGGGVNFCYYESGSYTFDNPVSTLGVTGSTTTQMQTSESYDTWNFIDIWNRNDSIQNGYPYLSWENLQISSSSSVNIVIISPNGGEMYFYNQIIPISWSFSNN